MVFMGARCCINQIIGKVILMKLLVLTNSGFVGDNNQLKGIAAGIQATKREGVELVDVEESKFDLASLEGSEIILVSGSHGLLMVDTIKSTKPDTKVIWSGHQYFREFNDISHKPDLIALPATSVSVEQRLQLEKSNNVVFTTGVAHSVNNETIASDHAKFKGQLPDHSQYPTQVGIIVAGDAPTADGKMQFFTAEDAKKQAEIIAGKLKLNGFDTASTAIMVTNGTRTGKHDPMTGLAHDPDPHRSIQIDASSEAFIGALKKALTNPRIFFYDFQFSALKEGPSAYKPMIKQVADSKRGLWFVPAESTSMVTEASFFLESKKPVVIYHPESENEVHIAHAKEAVAQGIACDISDDGISPASVATKIHSAATIIIEAIFKMVAPLSTPNVSSVVSTFYSTSSDGKQSAALAPGSSLAP